MTVTLVTIEGVEIVSTGTYQCASGEENFSAEDLAAAVQASNDPTVPAPRLKLGHNDPRFDSAIASGELDGEPAFGTVQNLRLSEDGQTVLGDYVDVPSWLGDTIQSSYPGRSIEGCRAFQAASGRTYQLAISDVALLGVTWPGVSSLADLREVLEQNGPVTEPVEAGAGWAVADGHAASLVVARVARPTENEPTPPARTDVTAGMDLGSVRSQFCGDLDDGEVPQVPDGQPQADDVGPQIWWWPRSVRVEDDGTLCLIVDDDEGHLIRIPFTVQQADLMYGEPQLVIEQYVPVTADPDDGVAARASNGPRVLASWPTRAASRPSTTTEVTTMDVDPAVLRTRLGLAEDADEAAITEALTATPEAPEPVEASTPQIPEGMTLIDSETLATIRQGAEQGSAVAARMARTDRDQTIQAAINEGRFPVSRRGFYEQAWESDPEGTRTLLTASAADGGLAVGLVPVANQEVGRGGDGENDPSSVDVDHDRFMAAHFPQVHRANAQNGRTRIRQEA